jgi:hypothetical protein
MYAFSEWVLYISIGIGTISILVYKNSAFSALTIIFLSDKCNGVTVPQRN